MPGAVAVMVIGKLPIAALLLTANVTVELPLPGAAIMPGLRLTVTPLGTPEADRLIELLNPFRMAVETIELPWLPCVMVSDEGNADRLNVPPGKTVTATLVLCWVVPSLPVTVM